MSAKFINKVLRTSACPSLRKSIARFFNDASKTNGDGRARICRNGDRCV